MKALRRRTHVVGKGMIHKPFLAGLILNLAVGYLWCSTAIGQSSLLVPNPNPSGNTINVTDNRYTNQYDNFGTIYNYRLINCGHLTRYFTNQETGSILNFGFLYTARDGGGIINLGTIYNSPTSRTGGKIRNPLSHIDNIGHIDNWGGIENSSVFDNSGTIDIAANGYFMNAISSGPHFTGTLDNTGIITVYGTLSNAASIYDGSEDHVINNQNVINIESAGTLVNENGIFNNYYALDNSGSVENHDQIYNSGVIFNDGSIDNGGTIDNSGTLRNYATGSISNGDYYSNDDSVINNSGTIDNAGTIKSLGIFDSSTGSFNNTGLFRGGGTFVGTLDTGIGTVGLERRWDDVATMNVDGNFILSDGGTLEIQVLAGRSIDFLDVTGAVDFQKGGTLRFSQVWGFDMTVFLHYNETVNLKFLRAGGEITGWSSVGHNFLDLPAGFNYSFYQQFDGLYITIRRPNEPPVADAGEDQTVHAGGVVDLDGSGSHDPDENYPLTYEWNIVSKPVNSAAELGDPSLVNPWFVPDLPGNYEVELVVTDSVGVVSLPDTVSISTFNTKPVADAGPDQALLELNVPVGFGTSEGRQSYDPDGDAITYEWTIIDKPVNSATELDDPTSATPTMLADQYGAYEVRLVVSDPWVSSDPDTVLVSFENLPPVACTTGNQSKNVDETVVLDGSCSTDANNDSLTYSWQFVSRPTGSQAQIDDPTADQTSFVADLPGTFVVGLVVNDGEYDSDPPANSSIYVVAHPGAVTDQLRDTIDTVNTIPSDALKNQNLKNPLTSKLNAAIEMVDLGLYAQALDKLQGDILTKTDGCVNEGEPDKNDWITDCQQQELLYAEVMRAIIILTDLL